MEADNAMLLTEELVGVIAAWSGGVQVEEINPENGERYPALNIQCKDEVKRASVGDWVIKEGDFFDVKKPNEFLHHITS